MVNMSTKTPLEIFPLEVWRLIFANLEGKQGSSADILSCSRTCEIFQDVLKPTKSQWLFETLFPLIFPYLDRRNILKCRSISKEWCRVIDTFIEDFESRHPFNEKTSEFFLRKEKVKGVCFSSKQEIVKFMEEMKNHGKNPFVGRSVCLKNHKVFNQPDPCQQLDEGELLDPDANREDIKNVFLNKASELLIMFGKHIKNFTLKTYYHDELHVQKFYELIRVYLLFLPNLKSLTIIGFFPSTNSQTSINSNDSISHNDLKMFLDSSSLPKISSLESLVLHGRGIPLPMCAKLIDEVNPGGLKRLTLAIVRENNDEDDIFNLQQPMTSLTELYILIMNSIYPFKQMLTNIINSKAPLQKIDFVFNKINQTIYLDELCEIINGFGPTLKKMAVKGDIHFPVISNKKLVMPHVRSLEVDSIYFGPEVFPNCFAQTLEYLHISDETKCSWIYRTQYLELVQQQMKLNKEAIYAEICNSFIWNDMPKLKAINFNNRGKVNIYTRQMHDHEANLISERINELLG